MERVAGVDEVRQASLVLIAQEAGLHDLDVGHPRIHDLRSQPVEHDRRHVHGDDARTGGGDGDGELSRPGAHVDDGRGAGETQALAEENLVGRTGVLLGVVAPDMAAIEVLPARVREFIEQPAGS